MREVERNQEFDKLWFHYAAGKDGVQHTDLL